jgi:DNA-directed RNA polymerase subunit RPC12/RpoP
MEVICESCTAKLNIPDEKIPKDQVVKIACPKCKNKVVLKGIKRNEPKAKGSGIEANHSPEPAKFRTEAKPVGKESGESYGYDDYADDEELVFFEEGTKLALLMASNSEGSKKILPAIEKLGYKPIPTSSTRDAIGKARFHHFDMVILMDGFDSQPLEQSAMIHYLNRLSMSVRRGIFVALISEQFKTMDDMMAFAMSANVVINSKDIERLLPILKKAISENEKFYKVFIDSLAETGKS